MQTATINYSALVIRQATTNDLAALRQLSTTTFRDTFATVNSAEDMETYEREHLSEHCLAAELADPGNTFWLAYAEAELIGYAKLRATKHPVKLEAQRPLELERLYVLQAHQTRKAGAALMGYCIDYGCRQGYDVLWLGVWEHNAKALAFYRKWGFEVFGSHIFQLGQAQDTDLLMQKKLSAAG